MKLKITITYEGKIDPNDYLDYPAEKPEIEEIRKRVAKDVANSHRYYTDRFKAQIDKVEF